MAPHILVCIIQFDFKALPQPGWLWLQDNPQERRIVFPSTDRSFVVQCNQPYPSPSHSHTDTGNDAGSHSSGEGSVPHRRTFVPCKPAPTDPQIHPITHTPLFSAKSNQPHPNKLHPLTHTPLYSVKLNQPHPIRMHPLSHTQPRTVQCKPATPQQNAPSLTHTGWCWA